MARDAGDGLLGQTLRGGEYELKEVIARGGQATVYRAYARRLDADVAVKILDPSLATDPAFRDRFHDEARSLARLHHPNLIEVHWYGEEADLVYIVMRLVGGGTLKDRLRALGAPLGLTEAARAIGQVAEALQHAHDRGVLHLDVKPANVLLGRTDWPLLTDLGLTRLMSRERTSSGHSRVAGTPAYMSPEQCRGADLDGRSDQYSLGVTAYELLTGHQPFRAETTDGLMQQHLEASPPRPREVNPGLPSPIEAVLLRSLAKDPAERYPTVREFGQALTAAVERTRGVALETKAAAAASIPNLIGILALVLATPLLLDMLPIGTILGRLPLAWPFQLLLAGGVAALLLGIRWHLVGLLGRAVAGPAGPSAASAWRGPALAACEGIVNLLYLLALFRLVGIPSLAVLRTLLDPSAYRVLDIGAPVLLGLAALAIVGGIARAAGALPAAIVLSVGWAVATVLPASDLTLSGQAAVLASTAQAVVAGGLVMLMVAHRRAAGAGVVSVISNRLARLLVHARPGASSEQVAASQRELRYLVLGVLDFAYLLLAYALLREPVVSLLGELATPVAAAIVVTACAGLVWLFLGARLYSSAGIIGAALGAVLGLPILVSLPVLEPGVIEATWPAAVASWLAAGTLLTLLVIVRGPTQAFSRAALGAQLDRGLVGAYAAPTEGQSTRRVSALGQVAGALIDVAFLLVAYWVVGVPATAALVRATGQPELSSLILAVVLGLSLVLIAAPARRAAGVLAETGGSRWRGRARAFTVLALASAAATVGLGGAAPTAIAGPSPLGPQGVSASMLRVGPPTVVVDWDFWQPWTPSSDEATYNLALRCSNGTPLGEFREVLTPPSNASMLVGSVGRLGATSTRCEDWQQVYQARRHAAGLTDAPSASWAWIDVQATVGPDGGVDVVQTQRALFSAGQHTRLTWDLGPAELGISGLEVSDADAQYVMDSPGQGGDHTAHTWERAGERGVEWNFPLVSSPSERTYVLRYHLAQNTPDLDTGTIFEHVIASAHRQEPVWRTTVRVRVPDQVAADSDLGLVTHGATAQAGRLDRRTVWFAASDLSSKQALSVGINRAQVAQAPPPTAARQAAAPPPAPVPDIAPAFLAGVTSGSSVPAGGDLVIAAASSPPVASAPIADVPPVAAPAEPGQVTPETLPAAATQTPEPNATSAPGTDQPDTPEPVAPTPIAVPHSPSTPTPAPAASAIPTATVSMTQTLTVTPVASAAPTFAPAPAATPAPTASPDVPTATPTRAASRGGSGGQGATATPTALPDTTPPVLVVTVQPARAAAGQSVLVTVLSSESLAGAPRVLVSGPCLPTMAAPVAPAASGGFTGAFTVPPGDGDCTAVVTATAADLAGNVTPGGSATMVVDRTPPALSVAADPSPAAPNSLVGVAVFSADEDLAQPPSIDVPAVSGCIPNDIHISDVKPSGPGRRFGGTFKLPDGAGGCTASIVVSGVDRTGNTSTARASLPITRIVRKFSLTVDVVGHGRVLDAGTNGSQVTCDQQCTLTFDEGTQLTLRGVGAPGFALDEFIGCTPIVSAASVPTCDINMNQDLKITAVFGGIDLVSIRQQDAAGRDVKRLDAGSLVFYPITMRNTSMRDARVTFSWEADQGFQDSFGWSLVRATSNAGFDCGEPRQHAGMRVDCGGASMAAGAEAQVMLVLRAPTRNDQANTSHTIGWRHDAFSQCCLSLVVNVPPPLPTSTATPEPSPSATPTTPPTPAPSPSATPSPAPSATATPSPTPEPSPTATPEPTATPPPILLLATPASPTTAPAPPALPASQPTTTAAQPTAVPARQPTLSTAPDASAIAAPQSVGTPGHP